MYLISQIFVVLSILLLGITYFLNDKKIILVLCLFYCIFNGLHYFILGALTGAIMTLISFIRNIYFFKNKKNNKKNSKLILAILVLISFIFCILTYEDVFCIISMLGSIFSTFAIWQDNIKVYKLLSVPVSLCFIIYSIHINSIVAIVIESILLIIEVIAIIKFYIDNTLTINKKSYNI